MQHSYSIQVRECRCCRCSLYTHISLSTPFLEHREEAHSFPSKTVLRILSLQHNCVLRGGKVYVSMKEYECLTSPFYTLQSTGEGENTPLRGKKVFGLEKALRKHSVLCCSECRCRWRNKNAWLVPSTPFWSLRREGTQNFEAASGVPSSKTIRRHSVLCWASAGAGKPVLMLD